MTRKVTLGASILAIMTAVAMLLTTSPAVAAKGKPTTESTNNLSTPAIVVPDKGIFTTLVCPGGPVAPTGTTAVYDGVTYYIQGQATWQAECNTGVAGLPVTAAWGDNLTGAPLKAGAPIRVEMGLIHTLPAGTTMTGYQVLNLTNVLDRTDTYGTTGVPTTFTEVRAYDTGAKLSIYNNTTQSWVLNNVTASAEINATGAIVYGYNWGSGKGSKSTVTAGSYTITFYAPNVVMTGADAGIVSADGHTVALDVTVNAKTSGKGGGGGHRG